MTISIKSMLFAICFALPSTALADENDKRLWDAAKAGDAETVRFLLDAGAEVDAKTEFGATALWFAARRGRGDVCQLLIERGAEVDVRDTAYGFTPIGMAAWSGNAAAVKALMDAGSTQVVGAAFAAASNGHIEVVKTVVEDSKLPQETLDQLYRSAKSSGRENVAEFLLNAGAKPPLEVEKPKAIQIDPELLKSYEGTFAASDDPSNTFVIVLKDGALGVGSVPEDTSEMFAIDDTTFGLVNDAEARIQFKKNEQGGLTGYTVEDRNGKRERTFVKKEVRPLFPTNVADVRRQVTNPKPWPSFRGRFASGIADGEHPPFTWDLNSRKNIRWTAKIPGLGHSSPIVWGNRTFITTAVGNPTANTKQEELGWIDAVPEDIEHQWKVLCYHTDTGELLWERTAHRGRPSLGRHWKASQANCTAATDGNKLVVFLGSEGLFCYDLDGNLVWKTQLGILDAGWYMDDSYPWGFASSPIIFKDLVFVQCDVQGDSFVAAYDLATGNERWRVSRDEIPSWCTPTIWESGQRSQLIVNATKAIRGYDAQTGDELWRLRGNSHITVASPIATRDMIFVTGGYQPVKPIYAIRPSAIGDITQEGESDSSTHVAWSYQKGGVYQSTPLAYGGRLYLCSGNGILSCYDSASGKRLYRKRIPGGGSYTASPVAADGRIYLTDEDGNVVVVKAGAAFEPLARNQLNGVTLATPAISNGMIIFRTTKELIGIGHTEQTTKANHAGQPAQASTRR